MRPKRISELRADVARVLATAELDLTTPAVDGWVDPGGAAQAIEQHRGALLVRARPPLDGTDDDTATDEEFAPQPEDGGWLLLDRDHEPRFLPLRTGSTTTLRVREVKLTVHSRICCDASRCAGGKGLAWVELLTADGSLRIAERVARGQDEARHQLTHLAHAIAHQLELPPPQGTERSERNGDDPVLTANDLARWSLHREGGRFVLRDHASRGPRELAAREWALTAALTIGGLATWFALSRMWAQSALEVVATVGAIGMVLSLAALATSFIARHSQAYSARSEALLYAYRSALILSPWVSRLGAIDPKPEGRYGAALPLAEIDSLDIQKATGGFALVFASSHGPYQLGVLESEQLARRWQRTLLELLDALTHVDDPARKKSSARTNARSRTAQAALLFVAAGCSSDPVSPATVPTGAPPPPSLVSPSAAVSSTEIAPAPPPSTLTPGPSPAPDTRPRLTIHHEQYDEVKARAARENKALFVEVWAPWCHTCLSMKNFVLTDPALFPLGERVVFVAIDSDRPENDAFLAKHRVNVWPTMFVIDPKRSKVLGLWQGAASLDELRTFITDAVDARDARLDPRSPLASMLAAKQAHARGEWLEAARNYRIASTRGGTDWPRRSEALAGQLFAEYRLGNWNRCATLGAAHIGELQGAAIPADSAWVVLSCSSKASEPSLAARARAATIDRLRRHTEAPPTASSVDDRSDALAMLARTLRQAGDPRGARRAVNKQIALLEHAAARASSPEHAATFDYARMGAYLGIGLVDKAIAMLRERSSQLPNSYEPRARLAQALMAKRDFKAAVAALEQAIALSYGARQLRYFDSLADCHLALRDRANARAALSRLLVAYDALPPAQKNHPPTRDLASEARTRLNSSSIR